MAFFLLPSGEGVKEMIKKLFLVVLITMLVFSGYPRFSGAGFAKGNGNGIPGKIVIKLKGEKNPRLLSVSRGKTARSLIGRTIKGRKVVYAEPDFKVKAFSFPNDPLRQYQWHLSRIRAEQATDLRKRVGKTKIAIIDTGISYDHPDLAGRIENGYDFINDDSDASDDYGHGTAVAGIAAATISNRKGVSSLAGFATLIPVKVLDSSGMGDSYGVSRGIIYAADAGADVINLSLGGPSDSEAMREAVAYAKGKGCVVVAAAGNEGEYGETPQYPASYPSVISVASTSQTDAHSYFSSHDPNVDVSAPGESILTTAVEGYGYLTGTSAAAPQVAGLAAFLLSKTPEASVDEIKQQILGGSKDLGVMGWDKYFGNGRIDAYHSVSGSPYVVVTTPESESYTSSRIIGIRLSDSINPIGSRGTIKVRNGAGKEIATRCAFIDKIALIRTASLNRHTYTVTIDGIETVQGKRLAGPYRFRIRATGAQRDIDDDIPGRLLKKKTTIGSLDSLLDNTDVYRFRGIRGKRIILTVRNQNGLNCGLYLFDSRTRTIKKAGPAVAANSKKIVYRVKRSGTHYIAVRAESGVGRYVISYR